MSSTAISKSDAARASSAHARINMPLNLENWKTLDEDTQTELLWYHQHILDAKLSWEQVEETVGYDRSSIFKFLKGTSTGSYSNFVDAVRRYRKLAEKRQSIQRQEFRHNDITRLMFSCLDYTLANNCMTLIVGESGMGKSTTMQAWRDENNHGCSVYVDCPAVGGIKGFLTAIASQVGVSGNMPVPRLLNALVRSFNPNRILLLDNMHRALPSDNRGAPRAFDIVQQIQEASGCAVGMSATARLDTYMRGASYMFEQITGRIGTPFYLPYKIKWSDIKPIVTQYIDKPSDEMKQICMSVANGPGRIRQVVERLKLASRIASKSRKGLNESHFLKAVQVRNQLSQNKDNRRLQS